MTTRGEWNVARQAFIVMSVGAMLLLLVFVLWKSVQVLLLLFAGLLLAIVFHTAAKALARSTRMPWALAVAIVLTVLLLVVTGGFFAVAPSVARQTEALTQNLEAAGQAASKYLSDTAWGRPLMRQLDELPEKLGQNESLWARLTGIFSTTLGAISGLLLILLVAAFLTASPGIYVRGLLRLIPIEKRDRAAEVLAEVGYTLKWWLVSQLISMLLLAVSTWLMLWLLNVPLALPLALLTGILTFVPYLGPIVALVPILLIALSVSPTLALYVFLLYMVIQNVEANVIMPIIYHKTVRVPPVLSISAQLVMGGLMGLMGVLLATPLIAAILIFVKRFYVEDVLGDAMDKPVKNEQEIVS